MSEIILKELEYTNKEDITSKYYALPDNKGFVVLFQKSEEDTDIDGVLFFETEEEVKKRCKGIREH